MVDANESGGKMAQQDDHSEFAGQPAGSTVDLIRHARAGDAAARDRLFARCRSYLNLMAQIQVETWMRGKADPSDIVQQTMLDAHKGFDNFRGETDGEWAVWLKQILSNNVRDVIRRYKVAGKRDVRREVSAEAAADDASRPQGMQLPGDDQTPSQALMGHEEHLLLAEAIEQLSEDHRRVILLRNFRQLPFEEIAAEMDRSVGATQMLWTRAVQQLEKTLRALDPSLFKNRS